MTSPAPNSPRWSAVGSWLGLLLMLVFALNTAGGWVRLSGSGVAIPHWPIIDLGSHRTVLPPWSDTEWQAAREAWEVHQATLRARIERGELNASNLGRTPKDMAGFKTLFLTEWSHRLLAAITGIVALGVLITVLRDGALRAAVGSVVGAAVLLIVAQAILGGLLVDQGTNTPWLWLHQGNAGAIMGCLLWSLLVVVGLRPPPVPGRRGLLILAAVAVLVSWSQLVTGALVAGSKGVEGGYIARDLLAIGNLWNAEQGFGYNLARNPGVAQWLHRWSAWGLTILLAVEILILWRARVGIRLRLVSQLLATFLGVQMLLGLASAAIGAQPLLILAHQATGMCLLLTSVLILFDVRSEPAEAAPQGQTVPSA